MKKSRSLKFTLLATAIISFAAGAAVCIGTALGSLSENFLLQEFSSLIMEMLFIFVIWVLLTSSTNTVLRQTYWIYSLRPNLHRFQKTFVLAYWSSLICAAGTVVLKHLPFGYVYLVGTGLSLISLLIYIVLFVTYKLNYIYLALTKVTKKLKKKIQKSIITNVVVFLIMVISILLYYLMGYH
ncbi:MAG: hypothetical protein KH357_12350 [Clostridiales bacterium]|nr:hypothetical protein [Clostridiales bacterium]